MGSPTLLYCLDCHETQKGGKRLITKVGSAMNILGIAVCLNDSDVKSLRLLLALQVLGFSVHFYTLAHHRCSGAGLLYENSDDCLLTF